VTLKIEKGFIQKAQYHDALRAVWFPEWKARVDIDIADAVQGKVLVKDAITGVSRDYMKMQMVNKLTGRPAIVAQHIIALRTH